MRPFNPKEYIDWWEDMRKRKQPATEIYISPFRVGTPEWEADVKKHTQEVDGVKIMGRKAKENR